MAVSTEVLSKESEGNQTSLTGKIESLEMVKKQASNK